MSVHAITWAFEQELPCAHKFVLVALADSCGSTGECWPSQGTLAEKCGLSRQHVNKVLGDLEASKHITISGRERKGGGDSSCLYVLALPPERNTGGQPEAVPGFVFVIEDGARCRIGVARDAERRRLGVSTALGREVRLTAALAVPMADGRQLASRAAEAFDAYRAEGEWYEVSADRVTTFLTEALEGDGVSIGPIPSVSFTVTGGVNQGDTGASPKATPVSTEPSMNEPSREPGGAAKAGGQLFDLPSSPKAKSKKSADAALIAEAFDLYNAAAERAGWQRCQHQTPNRIQKMKNRLTDAGGLDGIRAALEKAEASNFCNGRSEGRDGRAPFVMHIDFLLQQSSFTKLMEGHYDNRGRNAAGNGRNSIRNAAVAVAEDIDRSCAD